MHLRAHAVILLCSLLAPPGSASAQAGATNDARVQQWLGTALPRYLQLYRELHQSPELSLQESKTAARAARELRAAGYTVTTGVGGHGVVGVLANGPGPTLLIRADMDGLPVAEETGLAYASKVQAKDASGERVPVMHACGHDLHLTSLLASATFLASERKRWTGTLLIVAQPAEEIGEGSLRMIAAGLFERFPRPSHALALHVEPAMPAGQVGLTSGFAMANTDSVDVTLYGRGGHGSRPENAVDPIVIAAQYVTALQTLVSRRKDPREPAVVTVGSIHGGTKHNVIPDSVALQLTVRSYSDAVRALLLSGIAQLARDLCTAFGCPQPPDVKVKETYTPAVYNDPALTASAQRVLTDALGAQAVAQVPQVMGGEDFGRYGKQLRIPSLLFRVGATPAALYRASQQPGAPPLPSLHSSRFAPDPEPTLRTGVRSTLALALALLARK
jgi:amidohydrolase